MTVVFNDLYQLTMASAYIDAGIHEDQCTFDMFFRSVPKGWGYLVACGIDEALDYTRYFQFDNWDIEDLCYIKHSVSRGGIKINFDNLKGYLENNLKKLRDHDTRVRAVKEGTIVFPNEPVLSITGPRILCQLLETPLLNIINFQTLIASKASRIVSAANGRNVIEFGLRRAQGRDAAIKGTRASYIGGCIGTSNVEAGVRYDIPIMGTHAHSFVMSFKSELDAFRAYAKSFPNDSTFLIDTYDTLEGAKNAAIVGNEMKRNGFLLKGVRLDSGDLLKLSNQVRGILDSAGLNDVKIIASNDLNEFKIDRLIKMGAKIDSFGVGTELITAKPESALSGVYKLVEDINGDKSKKSESKKTMPGKKQILRYKDKDFVCSIKESENTRDLKIPSLLENAACQLSSSLKSISWTRDFVSQSIKNLPVELKGLEVNEKFPKMMVEFSAELIEREKLCNK